MGERTHQAEDGTWQAFEHVVDILYERYLADSDDPGRPLVVFVVGAGASMWSDMPSWGSIKSEIIEVAKGVFPQFLREACIRLEATIGVDVSTLNSDDQRESELMRASTDQLCGVACQIEIVREVVLKKLKELYGGPSGDPEFLPPQLAYELLAHLLKHGFADHVVTLNFDDLMSTAMKHELGPGEFELITSDHTIRSAAGDGARAPRVIQLHGSVQSEPTLRFTIDTTDVLTPGTKEVLRETLFDGDRPVHLISLGYSWRDQDLAAWVDSLADRIESATVVTLKEDPPDKLASEQWAGRLRVLYNDKLINGKSNLSIDHLLWAVWDSLKGHLGDHGDHPRPQPAARHVLLGTLFGPCLDSNGQLLRDGEKQLRVLNSHDAARRFRAEVILHVVKCQGMVTASMMARDFRIRRYRNHVDGAEFEMAIYGLANTPFLRRGTYPEVKETLFSSARNEAEFARAFSDQRFALNQIATNRGSIRATAILRPRVLRNKENKAIGIRLDRVTTTDFLKEQIKRIQDHPEVEIVRTSDPRTEWLFENRRQLLTIRELEEETRRTVSGDWSHLLIVAETGEWLTHPPFDELLSAEDGSPRQVLLLSAHLPSQDEWARKETIDKRIGDHFGSLQKAGVTVREASMPWWQHNRHLTLAVTAGRLDRAIFFQRPNKTSRIAPVSTEHAPDCVEVFVTFLTYVRRTLERRILEVVTAEVQGRTSVIEPSFCQATCDLAETVCDRGPVDERVKVLAAVIAKLADKLAALQKSVAMP